ncbi:MAG: efflux RND transporter periplasmic adaptor subunit [Treponema sp.]|nr:efflux RND transporter periplasmic adaptor subunit [Treponema sp.]
MAEKEAKQTRESEIQEQISQQDAATKKESFGEKMVSVKKVTITTVVVVVLIALTFGGIKFINRPKDGNKNGFGAPGVGAPAGKAGGAPGAGKPSAGGWGGAGATVTSVKTVMAIPQTMHDFVNTNGNIETQRSVDVFASATSGKVVQVNVSLGSKVNAGDIIAYVDSSAAGVTYKWSPVTAPISGSIIQTPVKVGQQINASTIITKIGDIDNLQISANIPERYVGALKPGLKAEITLQAYPGVVFKATVVRVSPVLDPASRTKTVILNFDKKDSRVNAGMFAKVKLYTVDYPNSIAIPQDAIVTVGKDSYLYVVQNNDTVQKRLVVLGQNVDGYYQIASGINPNEKVVVAGMLTLTDGAKVKDISANN